MTMQTTIIIEWLLLSQLAAQYGMQWWLKTFRKTYIAFASLLEPNASSQIHLAFDK